MKHVDIVIVGAGISGLMAVNTLKDSGLTGVQVIDKGKFPGGRMATRRIDGAVFDHGAQFITARTDIFRSIIKDWLDQAWIQPWGTGNHPKYAAVGGMDQLAQHLAQPYQLECSIVIDSIEPLPEAYLVRGRDIYTNESHQWIAQSVLLTCPIPQVFPILEAGGCYIDSHVRDVLEGVVYEPSLAVIIRMNEGNELSEEFLREPFPGIISWVADNRRKGISDVPAWTLHLDAKWSEIHYKDTDSEIWTHVLPLVETILGMPSEHEMTYHIKRWRFAKAQQLIKAPFMDIGVRAPLVLSGDAFESSDLMSSNGSKVEHAVLSGIAAGRYLAERMKAGE